MSVQRVAGVKSVTQLFGSYQHFCQFTRFTQVSVQRVKLPATRNFVSVQRFCHIGMITSKRNQVHANVCG